MRTTRVRMWMRMPMHEGARTESEPQMRRMQQPRLPLPINVRGRGRESVSSANMKRGTPVVATESDSCAKRTDGGGRAGSGSCAAAQACVGRLGNSIAASRAKGGGKASCNSACPEGDR